MGFQYNYLQIAIYIYIYIFEKKDIAFQLREVLKISLKYNNNIFHPNVEIAITFMAHNHK